MKTFEEWFQGKQGEPYNCMWEFAKEAWGASAENSAEEIAKRDARIKELEADQDKANAAVAIGNYLGKTYNYFWCDTSLASQTIDLLKEQAAEISRLREVIAKCKGAMEAAWAEGYCCHGPEGYSEDQQRFQEAIAAIKEERL